MVRNTLQVVVRADHPQHALCLAERETEKLLYEERNEERALLVRLSSGPPTALPVCEIVRPHPYRFQRRSQTVHRHVVVTVEVDRHSLELEGERIEMNLPRKLEYIARYLYYRGSQSITFLVSWL